MGGRAVRPSATARAVEFPVSAGGGTEPLWSPSGRELFYRNGDQMVAVPVTLEPQFDLGTAEVLFERRYAVTNRPDAPRNYDVSLDGQRFLMIEDEVAPFATELHVVTNWFEELKERVPVP